MREPSPRLAACRAPHRDDPGLRCAAGLGAGRDREPSAAPLPPAPHPQNGTGASVQELVKVLNEAEVPGQEVVGEPAAAAAGPRRSAARPPRCKAAPVPCSGCATLLGLGAGARLPGTCACTAARHRRHASPRSPEHAGRPPSGPRPAHRARARPRPPRRGDCGAGGGAHPLRAAAPAQGLQRVGAELLGGQGRRVHRRAQARRFAGLLACWPAAPLSGTCCSSVFVLGLLLAGQSGRHLSRRAGCACACAARGSCARAVPAPRGGDRTLLPNPNPIACVAHLAFLAAPRCSRTWASTG